MGGRTTAPNGALRDASSTGRRPAPGRIPPLPRTLPRRGYDAGEDPPRLHERDTPGQLPPERSRGHGGSPVNRRPVVVALLAALAVLAVVSLACDDASTVVIATEGNYHPFNFINAAGEIDGLERELGDELCRRARLECEWLVTDWENMIPGLRAVEFDVILAGMSITDERERLIDFTAPYYPPSPSVYLTRAEDGEEGVGGTVGTQRQTIYSDYFDDTGRSYAVFDDPDAALEALLAGEVDALLVDRGYALQKVAEQGGRLTIAGPQVALDQGLGLGVREGSYLRERLNEALASMKEDGTLNALLRKWIGEDADTF